MRLLIVLGLLHMFLTHVRNAELLAMLAPLAVAPVLARDGPRCAATGATGKMLFGGLAGLGRPPDATASALHCLGAVYAAG